MGRRSYLTKRYSVAKSIETGVLDLNEGVFIDCSFCFGAGLTGSKDCQSTEHKITRLFIRPLEPQSYKATTNMTG